MFDATRVNELNEEKDGVTGSGLVDGTNFRLVVLTGDDGRMGQGLIWLGEL